MSGPRAFVIGHPIAHSRSPLLHGFWLNSLGLPGSYERVDVTPDGLADFVGRLRAGAFAGGNVTVPHKTAMLPLIDRLGPAAHAIGAANTLWMEGDTLCADNTDASGFIANLDDEAPDWSAGTCRAVVLGAGGAARAVVHGLLGRGCAVAVANRTAAAAEALALHAGCEAIPWAALPEALSRADLLVNTTVLGMAGQPPLVLDLEPLPGRAVVCDIVYVPLETALLRQARARGNRVVGGLGMLLHQAVPGFERWFGMRPTVTAALRAILEADLRGRS